MSSPFIGCTLKQLPEEHLITAAKKAIEVNPTNQPHTEHILTALGEVLGPLHLAVLTSKRWPADKGCHLTVQFLDNPTASCRKRILDHANKWSTRANISFVETSGQGQIRLTRVPGDGYWSYLGTDILSIPTGQATMNLDSFTDATPEKEYLRVVPHEFFHSAGGIHEQFREGIIDLLDRNKTITVMMRDQGWSEDMVIQQCLTPRAESELLANAPDVRSIMEYWFSGECTKNGQPIIGGTDIDESDFQLAAKVYPLAVTPPPIQPPPPSSGRLFGLTFPHAVAKNGAVFFHAPVPIPAGEVDVVTKGMVK